MAITRDKKHSLVSNLSKLLSKSKMTVYAKYSGLTVSEIQSLRKVARNSNVTIMVVKNRLVKVAIEETNNLKDVDASDLKGQLIYALSDADEVAPAQVLNNFSKDYQNLQLIGGITGEGKNLCTDEIRSLAQLPGKNELIGSVIAQLQSPVNDVVNALSGNLHSLLGGIENKVGEIK